MKPVSSSQDRGQTFVPPQNSSFFPGPAPGNNPWGGALIPLNGSTSDLSPNSLGNNPTIYNIIQINQFNQNQLFNLSGNGSQNLPSWQPSNESPLTNFLQMPPTTGASVPGSHFFQMRNAGSQSQPLPSSGMPNTGMNVAQMPPSGMPNTGGLPQSMPSTGMPPANFQTMANPAEAQLEQQLTTICIMLIQSIQKMVMSILAQRNAPVDEPSSSSETEGPEENPDDPTIDDHPDEMTPGNLQDIDERYGDIVQEAVDEANRSHPGSKLTKNYVLATIMRESGGDPNAVGDGGTSIGLMQINDAHGLSREDRLNPETAIRFAVNLMAGYNAKYDGDIAQTAMAYMTGDDANGPYGGMAREYADAILSIMDGGGG